MESAHAAHLVVTGEDGEVLASLGDAEVTTFIRSAAKPFQATACLEILDAFGTEEAHPSGRELAVAWASHRGEARHLEAVAALLARSGTAPEELTCPSGVPEAAPGAPPAKLQHNCSGKHALFALAGRALGVDRATLLDPDGALQGRVLALLAEELGPPSAIGVDGCGAPALAVPLRRLAGAFAAAAGQPRYARVRAAGLAYPGLVGGEGRLESALLGVGVVAKVGAEGVYGVGWRAADGGARGLAVKSVDGAARGVAEAVISLLTTLEVVPRGTWASPPPLGGGAPVGTVRGTPEVTSLAQALAGHV
ncbi:MAG: asparaginase [Nitriliruptoraceae bacterium]